MKKIPLHYLIFFCLFIFSSTNCDNEPEIPPVRTIQDVEEDFSNIDISEGTHDESLEFLLNKFWNFRVIAPQTVEGESYPLVIHLHGASGGNPDAHKSTECYVEPGFENIDAFTNVYMVIHNGIIIREDN